MSETNGKKVYEYVSNPRVDEIPQEQRLVYAVTGKGENTGKKFETYWLVPETDEEAKERYDIDLAYLIRQGVRSLATRPQYPAEGTPEECQAAADGYIVGRKAPATGGQKAKAGKYDKFLEMAKAAGFESVEDWIGAGAPQV